MLLAINNIIVTVNYFIEFSDVTLDLSPTNNFLRN